METIETQISSTDELLQFITTGQLWNFCVGFALNKGFRNALTEKQEIKFSVGDYEVSFDAKTYGFTFNHKVYFARIIQTYPNGETVFIGDDEQEIIDDVLKEFEKEI